MRRTMARGSAMSVGFLAVLLFSGLASGEVSQVCKFDDGEAGVVAPSEWSSSQLFISGGTVVNADRQFEANVYIEDGIIKAVGAIQAPEGVRVVDATGKLVMPGGIDPHTHLSMPFMGTETVDDFYSGQLAALAGGTTMHIDFALPLAGDLAAGYEAYVEKSRRAVMDYGFHMAITTWNDKVAEDMAALVEKGINSFKFFMAYKGELQVSDEQLLAGMQRCKDLGALPMVHAESGDAVEVGRKRVFELGIKGPEGHSLSRPPVLEGEATSRAIKFAKFVGVPLYVVHVMSIDALEEIARARQAGQRVIGEPITAGLVLTEQPIWDPDFEVAARFVMSPPIRSEEHRTALQGALANGILQLVGTDHCPFNSTQKAMGMDDFRSIPNGINGIEERMHLTWDTMVNSGLITPSDFVRITSTACAQIFNIYPQKGVIAPGSDADIIVLNPNGTTTIRAENHHSRLDTNVFDGYSLKGKVDVTISQGRVVWEDGQLSAARGSGRFVQMRPFGPLFHGLDKLDAALRASFNAPVDRSSGGKLRPPADSRNTTFT